MSTEKNIFDVRDESPVARVKHTLMFFSYLFFTVFLWLVYGGLIRRAYRKALAEDRTFYIDCLPFGKKKTE